MLNRNEYCWDCIEYCMSKYGTPIWTGKYIQQPHKKRNPTVDVINYSKGIEPFPQTLIF